MLTGATGINFAAAPAAGNGSVMITFSGVAGPSCMSSVAALCGHLTVQSSAGVLDELQVAPVPASPPPPPDAAFPCGLVGFRVTHLTPGQSVTITENLPPGVVVTSYFKLEGGTWISIPATVSGSQIQFTLTDGGTADGDGVANGTIVDPGGPGVLVVAPKFTG